MNDSNTEKRLSPGETEPHIPTSVVLERLISEVPTGSVTMIWLMDHLHRRSFGLILLLLGAWGMIPGISPLAGVLLVIPALQMIRARRVPVFPRRFAGRSIPTAKLSSTLRRIIPSLRFLERFVRPRWPMPHKSTQRVIGGFLLLLAACLLIPVPLTNIPFGMVIILMAFAYLEEDGLLLALSLIVAAGLFTGAATLIWSAFAATLRMAS